MKKFRFLTIALVLGLAASCGKPMTEAEKKAEIEREVQARLAAERQAAQPQPLAQQPADADAREEALAEEEADGASGSTALATPRPTARAQTSDSHPRVSSEAGAEQSYDTFYRKLEPHGAWRETADYGYVFQPREAQQSRSWRPYTEGRWAYTDAGWTWVSEEPFGWATYHYGRWTRLKNVGWVWVPGEEWAPAWVSWRKSDEHVGWAPLPPEARFERSKGIKKWADSYYDIGADEYVFIPNEDIGAQEVERVIVPVERNVTIINRTTNVTDITYSNTTIVSEGPNFEELRGRSRRPIERLRLERQYEVQDQAAQPVVRGEVLSLMAPIFTSRAAQRPRNVGEPIRQVTVERNWVTSENPAEAESARAKMKSEATPPPDAPSKKFERPAIVEGTPVPAAATTAAPVPPQPTASVIASPAATRPVASPSPAVSATPATAASATLTPRPTVAATAAPATTPAAAATTTTPVATTKPVVTATPAVTATPVATAKPAATATPIADPTATPSPVPTAVTARSPASTATPPSDLQTGDIQTGVGAIPQGPAPAPNRGAAGPRPRSTPRALPTAPVTAPGAPAGVTASPGPAAATGEGASTPRIPAQRAAPPPAQTTTAPKPPPAAPAATASTASEASPAASPAPDVPGKKKDRKKTDKPADGAEAATPTPSASAAPH